MLAISGKPGVGKTTLVLKLADELRKRNIEFHGIATPEIRKGGKRLGFELINLKTGQRHPLASVEIRSSIKVGKYYVNPEAREFILSAINGKGLLLFDELGPMELKLVPNLAELIKEPAIVTVHRSLAKRFDAIWLTRENFPQVFELALGFALERADLF